MKATLALPLVVLAVALPAAVASGAPAMTLSFVEQRVTTDPGDQYDSAISGDIVVFTDYRAADTDVYYVDLATGTEHPVIVAPGNQELTGVSGSRIVYTDYRTADVVLFDLSTGTRTNLTAPDKDRLGRPINSVDPAISGDLVAWQDNRDGDAEIYALNLATGEERRVTDSTDGDSRPSVSGDRVAWQRCVAGGTCDIWTYDWASEVTTQVTDTPSSNERNPNIDSGRIVYQGDATGGNDIYAYDLADGVVHRAALAGEQANPHVSGDFVSFDDLSTGMYHVRLWHIPTGAVFDGTSGTAGQYLNDIEGNRVVYTDDRNGDLEIYMSTFTVHAGDTTPTLSGPSLVTVDATTPSGGVATFDVTATDDVTPTPGVTCDPPSGNVFPMGDTVVTCTASDEAGNTATMTLTVHVRDAAEQLANLQADVHALGLRPVLALTLQAELQGAQAAVAAGKPRPACAALGLFAAEVRLASGRGIPAAEAADLVAAANRIRAVLGC